MNPIRIFISGDFAPRLRVSEMIKMGEYGKLFGNILPYIKNSDYAITNLELPLTDKTAPLVKTGPNLIAPSKTVDVLKFAGFDMVTLANNHMLDQGAQGIDATICALDKIGIAHIGAGKDLGEAQRFKVVTINDTKIAFLNCCENEWSTTTGESYGCNPLNEVALYYQISEAKQSADYVILIIHGGHETFEYPSPRMVKLYRWFVDIGVDAVVGHHTHCYSGRELYKGKPIIYSLGNFIFDHPIWRDNFWTHGTACILTIDRNGISLEMIPFYQCGKEVGVILYSDEEKATFDIEDISKTRLIKNPDKLAQKYSDFLEKQQKLFNAYVEPFSNLAVRILQRLHIMPMLLRPSKRMLLLNLIRCEAHRDILIDLLDRTRKK